MRSLIVILFPTLAVIVNQLIGKKQRKKDMTHQYTDAGMDHDGGEANCEGKYYFFFTGRNEEKEPALMDIEQIHSMMMEDLKPGNQKYEPPLSDIL